MQQLKIESALAYYIPPRPRATRLPKWWPRWKVDGRSNAPWRQLLLLLILSTLNAEVLKAGDGAPSHFSFTGSLAKERYAHSAVLLPSGQVLVAGGGDGNGAVLRSELYDPATGSWSATGNLVATSFGATAVLLQSGKVLLAGNGPGTAQLYDPSSGTWSATGSFTQPRRDYTTTLLPNGKVLVAGGSDANGTSVSGVDIYDPASATWQATGSLAVSRSNHTATLLGNGKVLVAGGYHFIPPASSDDGVIATAELYNPATGKWSLTEPLQTARQSHTATLLPSGHVLVGAGSGAGNYLVSAELYDPTSQTWTATGSLAAPRVNYTATLLPTGLVIAIGGSGSGTSGYVTTAEVYNPGTAAWTPATDLPRGRALHSATLLPSGRVLVAGGYRNIALSSAELYDPDSLSMPVQLRNIATRLRVLSGDKAMIGGFIITGTAPKKVMLRAIGPSLSIPGGLADPTLELHLPRGVVTNDNWKINDQTGQSQEAEIQSTSIPPSSDLESAIVQTLAPGSYTAIVRGKDGGQGTAVVEAYDLDQTAPAQLANISTRGFVDQEDNVMIGGFILGPGDAGQGEILVRAIGPSLPLNGTLSDPTLTVYNGEGFKLASNDNWKVRGSTGETQEAEIRATTIPPTNSLESALLMMLPPGNYTAIVAGNGGATGTALVEVYNLH